MVPRATAAHPQGETERSARSHRQTTTTRRGVPARHAECGRLARACGNSERKDGADSWGHLCDQVFALRFLAIRLRSRAGSPRSGCDCSAANRRSAADQADGVNRESRSVILDDGVTIPRFNGSKPGEHIGAVSIAEKLHPTDVIKTLSSSAMARQQSVEPQYC